MNLRLGRRLETQITQLAIAVCLLLPAIGTAADAAYTIAESATSVRTNSAVTVGRPCALVWRVFIDLRNWQNWNGDLYVVQPVPETPSVGGLLFLEAKHTPLDAFPFVVPVTVKLTQVVENQLFVWEGKPWGVYGHHGFMFGQQSNGSCLIRQWEKGFGAGAKLGRVLGVFDSIGRIHVNFLNALKTRVEATE